MSYHISAFVGMLYQLLSIGFVAVVAHYYMLFLIPVVTGFCMDLLTKTIPSIIETAKLMRLTKSPILTSVQETMSGASTIRVYGRSEEFIRRNNALLDKHLKAIKLQQGVNSWFAIKVDFISLILMAVLSLACIFLRE